jgi:hypothetical protein
MSLKLETYLDYIERCNTEAGNQASDPTGEDDLLLCALSKC